MYAITSILYYLLLKEWWYTSCVDDILNNLNLLFSHTQELQSYI